jgi:hypothetical protein
MCGNKFLKSNGEFERGFWFCSIPCLETFILLNPRLEEEVEES